MADWASLPHDLLVLLGGLLKKFDDFAAFGTVCKSWHGAASKEHFKALWLRERTPYLMLPVRDGNTRDLYSLAEAEVVASVRVPNLSKRKCYESLGWLLAVEKDGSMCLLDPFSSTEIPLPPLDTTFGRLFTLKRAHIFVKKMVLSARPTDPSDPSNFVVALIFRSATGVAFWKPGDKSWHLTPFTGLVYEDITYHAGTFYVFDEEFQVTTFSILEGFPKEGQVIVPYRADAPLFHDRNVYLVKLPDSLLLVTRLLSESCWTRRFNVYELHVPTNSWTRINNLGNIALFLGSDIATTVVDSKRFPGFVKANHIYFTDDGILNPFREIGEPGKAVTGEDMGVYNLGNERTDAFYHGEAFKSKVSHPAWILPFLWS